MIDIFNPLEGFDYEGSSAITVKIHNRPVTLKVHTLGYSSAGRFQIINYDFAVNKMQFQGAIETKGESFVDSDFIDDVKNLNADQRPIEVNRTRKIIFGTVMMCEAFAHHYNVLYLNLKKPDYKRTEIDHLVEFYIKIMNADNKFFDPTIESMFGASYTNASIINYVNENLEEILESDDLSKFYDSIIQLLPTVFMNQMNEGFFTANNYSNILTTDIEKESILPPESIVALGCNKIEIEKIGSSDEYDETDHDDFYGDNPLDTVQHHIYKFGGDAILLASNRIGTLVNYSTGEVLDYEAPTISKATFVKPKIKTIKAICYESITPDGLTTNDPNISIQLFDGSHMNEHPQRLMLYKPYKPAE